MPIVRPRLPSLSVSGRDQTLRYSEGGRGWRDDLREAARETRWVHLAGLCAIAFCVFALAALNAAVE